MEHTNAELAQQPAGYWSGVAHEAIIGYIHDEDSKLGATQRHWMTLNTLIKSEGGLTRAEVTEELRQYMTPQIGDVSTYAEVLDDLLGKGWITAGIGGRLTLTEEGRTSRARLAELAVDIRRQLHDGVSDEDYVVALKVLRRIIENAGGSPRARSGNPTGSAERSQR